MEKKGKSMRVILKRLVEPGNEGMWKYVKCAGLTVIIVLALLVATVNTGKTGFSKYT